MACYAVTKNQNRNSSQKNGSQTFGKCLNTFLSEKEKNKMELTTCISWITKDLKKKNTCEIIFTMVRMERWGLSHFINGNVNCYNHFEGYISVLTVN
jgi:hypothetical protein